MFTIYTISDKIDNVKKLVNALEIYKKLISGGFLMNNIYPIPTTACNDNFKNAILANAQQIISNAAISAEKESKEKYETKSKLIEEATDMSTQEKLDALDKNYERRNQEIWQNPIAFAVVSIGIVGLIIGSPVAIKSIRKFLVA